jgi:hypothetical protein
MVGATLVVALAGLLQPRCTWSFIRQQSHRSCGASSYGREIATDNEQDQRKTQALALSLREFCAGMMHSNNHCLVSRNGRFPKVRRRPSLPHEQRPVLFAHFHRGVEGGVNASPTRAVWML